MVDAAGQHLQDQAGGGDNDASRSRSDRRRPLGLGPVGARLCRRVAFGLYTAAAAFLLLLGVGAGLAASVPAVLAVFRDAADSRSALEPVWRLVVRTAPLSEAPGQILPDYLLSGLNLGLGVWLVWHRPLDGVARLLGLGMVSTAAAFNLRRTSRSPPSTQSRPSYTRSSPSTGSAWGCGCVIGRRTDVLAKWLPSLWATLAGRPRVPVGPERVRPADLRLTPDDALISSLEHHPPVALAVEALDASARQSVEGPGVRLLVPLVAQGRLVGLLSVGDPTAGRGYSADDLLFLTALAKAAAPAVRIAHLLARERARALRDRQPA